MRAEGVAAAARELKRAWRAHRRIVAAKTPDAAEDAWVDFLTHSNRVYLKLRAACHGHPLDWMWWRRMMDERRSDPLLSYVHHARNTDTHRLEDTVEWIADGAFKIHVVWLGDLPVGKHLKALPVTDKGTVYLPPTEHFGAPFPYPEAQAIAAVAAAYLSELVTEAMSRLR
jgi:hypothetical protein